MLEEGIYQINPYRINKQWTVNSILAICSWNCFLSSLWIFHKHNMLTLISKLKFHKYNMVMKVEDIKFMFTYFIYSYNTFQIQLKCQKSSIIIRKRHQANWGIPCQILDQTKRTKKSQYRYELILNVTVGINHFIANAVGQTKTTNNGAWPFTNSAHVSGCEIFAKQLNIKRSQILYHHSNFPLANPIITKKQRT